YLKRDSFYTGVAEGNINSERLITMLNVVDNELAIEEKGIYSVEKFLVARRLMYWQVYLHKTGLAAEQLLIRVLQRAKELVSEGVDLKASTALEYFLTNKVEIQHFDASVLDIFSRLDDYDIISAMKEWQFHDDFVLSRLCTMILNRDLLKIKYRKKPFPEKKLEKHIDLFKEKYDVPEETARYFVFTGKVENLAYSMDKENIHILMKSGKISDVVKASDLLNLKALSRPVTKYYACYPKHS